MYAPEVHVYISSDSSDDGFYRCYSILVCLLEEGIFMYPIVYTYLSILGVSVDVYF